MDDASPEGYRNRLRAIVDLKLGKNIADVHLYRIFRDREIAGNFLVSFSCRHKRQHLNFARADRFVNHVLRELLGQRGRKPPLPCVNATDCSQQFAADDSLCDVALRSSFKCALDVDVALMGTQDDNACVRRLLFDLLDQIEAGHIRQLQIHESYIWSYFEKAFKRLGSGRSSTRNCRVRLEINNCGYAVADDWMIIHAGYSYLGCVLHSGDLSGFPASDPVFAAELSGAPVSFCLRAFNLLTA